MQKILTKNQCKAFLSPYIFAFLVIYFLYITNLYITNYYTTNLIWFFDFGLFQSIFAIFNQKEKKVLGASVDVVHLLSHVRLFVTPWTAANQASLSFTISQNLLKLMSIESMMPSNYLILCHALLLLLSILPSISLFQRVGCLHHVVKVLELQLQNQSFQWIFWVDFLEDWLI